MRVDWGAAVHSERHAVTLARTGAAFVDARNAWAFLGRSREPLPMAVAELAALSFITTISMEWTAGPSCRVITERSIFGILLDLELARSTSGVIFMSET